MDTVTAVRSLAGVRSLLGSPDRIVGHPAGPAAAGVVRFLGARQVAQAAVAQATGWHALSAAVDVLHAATMLPLLASPRWRRFGATQAATAALLIALELRAQR